MLAVIVCFSGKLFGQHHTFPNENPVELGKVNWFRDYDQAIKMAESKKLPVLILFQEVPGCSNCTTYGSRTLSHPLIVEAIESYFVPLCIYNNKEGKDRNVLNKFNEPTWNNPVVRIVDHTGHDLVPRQSDFRKTTVTLNTLMEGIRKSGQKIPEYLNLLMEETRAIEYGNSEEVFFSMYCFWSGEKEISAIKGVTRTNAGFMHGKEVVKITFDKSQISLPQLFAQANKVNCGDEIFGSVQAGSTVKAKPIGQFRKDKEDKYYLYHSPYKSIPMTELQKTKTNRLLALGHQPDHLLSPKQMQMLNSKNKTLNYIAESIETVWWARQ